LATNSTTSRRFQIGTLGFLIVIISLGCSQERNIGTESLFQRILPPPNTEAPAELPIPKKQAEPSRAPAPPEPAQSSEAIDSKDVKWREVKWQQVQVSGASQEPTQAPRISGEPSQVLNLTEAIALAFRLQPRLRASLESIQQARGREDIAFAAFLPTAGAAYTVGGLKVDAGGTGFPITGQPNSPSFTFLPVLGTVPVGLTGETGFELAELKLQWLISDFGRRLGRFNQATIAVDIAQLQTQRAYQTIANDVAAAYFQVLRTRSLRRIAAESVRRAEDDLEVARKLAKGGEIIREKVLRAETALAQAHHALDSFEEAEAIAVAGLNLAVGLNVSAATSVQDTTEAPPLEMSLSECLAQAVGARREFQVARQSVRITQEGSRVASADFAPRITAEGVGVDFQQSSPRGHFDVALAHIKLEWSLYDGGKRVAELRVSESRTREALAQADSIADTIAFQVNQAYRQLVAARKAIERARPAVDQTRETFRLVQERAKQGDAIPAELTDAETAFTRAQQEYFNAIYDHLIARARLEYAMGISPTPATIAQQP
jgi:outer membrane protein TolC